MTGVPAVNCPSPLPSRIETLSEPSFATARSSGPPLKFPTATEVGWVPTVTSLLNRVIAEAGVAAASAVAAVVVRAKAVLRNLERILFPSPCEHTSYA